VEERVCVWDIECVQERESLWERVCVWKIVCVGDRECVQERLRVEGSGHPPSLRRVSRRFTAIPRSTCPKVRKIDVRLPGKGNSKSRGERPVHLIITMIKWIRTRRVSTENYLSAPLGEGFRAEGRALGSRV